MRIVTILGARPQFIKAAPVLRAFGARSEIQSILIHTGQHYDPNLSDLFFDEMQIPRPDYPLGIGSGSHGEQTGRMLTAIEKTLLEVQPDRVVVYGDTNSTLAGALAAAKLQIRVAHVEAGLRSFNRQMPEEINRVLTDQIADLLFTPTETAVTNLRNEGIDEERIAPVGDVMYDAALQYAAIADAESRVLDRLELEPKHYILATIHRAENTDNRERLAAIMEGLARVAETVPVVLPLHPRTAVALEREGLMEAARKAVRLIEPIGYLDMVRLEKNAAVMATDSGGVQKEAFFFGVPCVTLRDETEWVELVRLGWNRLCPPTGPGAIAAAIREATGTRGEPAEPYGDGRAAEKVAERLLDREGPQ